MRPLIVARALLTRLRMAGAGALGGALLATRARAQILSLAAPLRIVRGRFAAGPGTTEADRRALEECGPAGNGSAGRPATGDLRP